MSSYPRRRKAPTQKMSEPAEVMVETVLKQPSTATIAGQALDSYSIVQPGDVPLGGGGPSVNNGIVLEDYQIEVVNLQEEYDSNDEDKESRYLHDYPSPAEEQEDYYYEEVVLPNGGSFYQPMQATTAKVSTMKPPMPNFSQTSAPTRSELINAQAELTRALNDRPRLNTQSSAPLATPSLVNITPEAHQLVREYQKQHAENLLREAERLQTFLLNSQTQLGGQMQFNSSAPSSSTILLPSMNGPKQSNASAQAPSLLVHKLAELQPEPEEKLSHAVLTSPSSLPHVLQSTSSSSGTHTPPLKPPTFMSKSINAKLSNATTTKVGGFDEARPERKEDVKPNIAKVEKKTVFPTLVTKVFPTLDEKSQAENKIMCMSHNSVCELFCRTQKKAVCIKCVRDCFASKHEIDVLEKVLMEYRNEYIKVSDSVVQLVENLNELQGQVAIEAKKRQISIQEQKKQITRVFDEYVVLLSKKKEDLLRELEEEALQTRTLFKLRMHEIELAQADVADVNDKYCSVPLRDADLIDTTENLKKVSAIRHEAFQKLQENTKSIPELVSVENLVCEADQAMEKIITLKLDASCSSEAQEFKQDGVSNTGWKVFRPIYGCSSLTNGGRTLTATGGSYDVAFGDPFCPDKCSSDYRTVFSVDQYDGISTVMFGLNPNTGTGNMTNGIGASVLNGISFSTSSTIRYDNGAFSVLSQVSFGGAIGYGGLSSSITPIISGDKFEMKVEKANGCLSITRLRDGQTWSFAIDLKKEYTPILMLTGHGQGFSFTPTTVSIV